VNKVDEIDFHSSEERHTFGDLYEQILKDLQSSGNSGEFYIMSSSFLSSECHLKKAA
jgi:type I restriction-modification system DNA methylase subunit